MQCSMLIHAEPVSLGQHSLVEPRSISLVQQITVDSFLGVIPSIIYDFSHEN